jgi:hypothetical protein
MCDSSLSGKTCFRLTFGFSCLRSFSFSPFQSTWDPGRLPPHSGNHEFLGIAGPSHPVARRDEFLDEHGQSAGL